MKELTATEITKDALLMLQARNVKAWRQNNHATRGRRNNVKYSIPDILGHHRKTGLSVFVEVKKIGDRLSESQIEFLSEAHLSGALTMIATQKGDKTVLIDFLEYHTP